MTGLYEELQEEDLLDIFTEFGSIKSLHFNIDKRTGYAKGYAFIEYQSKDNGRKAIDKMNGEEVAGQKVKIDWAFKKERKRSRHRRRRSRSRS